MILFFFRPSSSVQPFNFAYFVVSSCQPSFRSCNCRSNKPGNSTGRPSGYRPRPWQEPIRRSTALHRRLRRLQCCNCCQPGDCGDLLQRRRHRLRKVQRQLARRSQIHGLRRQGVAGRFRPRVRDRDRDDAHRGYRHGRPQNDALMLISSFFFQGGGGGPPPPVGNAKKDRARMSARLGLGF